MADDQENDQTLPVDPALWQRECELAAFLASFLLRLTRRSYASSAVIELLRTFPRSADTLEEHEKSGLFWRLFSAAHEMYVEDDRDYVMFQRCTKAYMELSEGRRAMIQASVIGSLIGTGTG